MLNAFTPDVSATLPGPAWLADLRRSAVDGLGSVPPPSADEEVWRYSRIGDLHMDRYRPLSGQPAVEPGVAVDLASFGERAATIELHNGWLVSATLSDESRALGATAGRIGDLADGADHFGAAQDQPVDLFDHLNRAFGPEPVAVVVPDGVRLEAPVVVVVHTDSDGAAVFPRLMVHCGADAAVTIVELHTSVDVGSLVVPVLEATVGRDGRLRHALVQDVGRRVWQLCHQTFQVGQSGSVESFVVGLGGDYARTRTDCRLVGRGAEARLTAAYFGEGDQTLDFRTFQDHAAPDTTSELLFKGAVAGRSHSVYSGLIRVRPEGVRTRARQTNRNIKLSPEAWAQSVPNLEIETDDVVCSHASTVSPVDEDQRFYLESRGVPTPVAERLLVEGFFADVIDAAPVPAVADLLRRALVDRLDRRFEESLVGGKG
ncbi:MAG: Fe-S cluster assembly protein SufD [Acidimicrobiales bacterium]|nr:Fe-S cluster assembly protein SufD [Acidimicrobiales bacterium]